MSNLRQTKFYKHLNSYAAVSVAEGFCDFEPTEKEQLAAWQWLHDKRLAYQLQGWFGRTAQNLIENELIRR